MKQQRRQRIGLRFPGSGNPLRRQVDKIESAVIGGLIIGFLLAAPLLAFFAARATGAAAISAQRAERAWREVPAVLGESAAASLTGLDAAWGAAWVPASWTAPAAGRQAGLVAAPLNSRAGQRIWIWVTPTGQLTNQPLTNADVREQEATAAMLVCAGLAVLVVVGAGAVRVVANRRRMAAWDRAWAAAGPRWSSFR